MSQNLKNSLALIKSNSELSADEQLKIFRKHTGAGLNFINGTHILRYCGVVGTASSGSPSALLASWSRAATKKLKKKAEMAGE